MSIKVLSELKVGTVLENIAAGTKSGSNNEIHNIDFAKSHANYTLTPGNVANNSITFSNLGADVVGKNGSIIIVNPGLTGSYTWRGAGGLPATAFTPGGQQISFDTTASKTAIITYFIVASNKVLINYAGAFSAYEQPAP
tara:strand:- start:3811 stop:4230 length:420 start_codon:yes stop_codon:yes gene_type:complete